MKNKTLLTEELENADDRARFDNQCKRLLSIKTVLAHILKGCVREFKNCGIDEIISCIEGEPVISETPVNCAKPSGDMRISGISSECPQVNETDVSFDIRFRARTSQKNKRGKYELIEIIINIEAQNQYRPSISGNNVKHASYHLTSRGVYYTCRQISAQYGEEFANSDYDSIKKVYTIFICNDVPKRRQNTISRYHITEEDVVGHVREDVKYYDLMEVILVRLGEDDSKKILEYTNETDTADGDGDGKRALRFLRVLLAGEIAVNEKLNILENEFDIKPTNDDYSKIAEEVDHMHGMSSMLDTYYNKGIIYGMKQGIERGMQQGIERGMQQERESSIINMASALKEIGISKEITVSKLMEKYNITRSKAESCVNSIWQNDFQTNS